MGKTQLKATLIKFMDETNSHHLLQDILVTGIHNWIHRQGIFSYLLGFFQLTD
jgi:hypothetical protein